MRSIVCLPGALLVAEAVQVVADDVYGFPYLPKE